MTISNPIPSSQPGAFHIFLGAWDSGWYFKCNCPCGCKFPDIVPLHRAGDPPLNPIHKFWEWDGNMTHPTITPSFKRHTPCGVHFNLTKGVYIIHGDGAPGAANIYRAP